MFIIIWRYFTPQSGSWIDELEARVELNNIIALKIGESSVVPGSSVKDDKTIYHKKSDKGRCYNENKLILIMNNNMLLMLNINPGIANEEILRGLNLPSLLQLIEDMEWDLWLTSGRRTATPSEFDFFVQVKFDDDNEDEDNDFDDREIIYLE
ncbi:hypothetical protein K501DRAFT_278323 [Backusella circina FSU 941]|nr:hypothetical protein K501DRAFT_278323 [Backusella circina FSU 941]